VGGEHGAERRDQLDLGARPRLADELPQRVGSLRRVGVRDPDPE
jgi:hypothetical protein